MSVPRAYYSEFDPKAAAWLRELIKRGLIADGDVDERDLWDVAPADLAGYTQVHLCAGIGAWSYALRRAGWPDDRPVWTGSFPCQPFSAAGKGAGFADERHLWPAGYHLIAECRPPVVFGEQVASKDAEPWLDLVQADLEAVGYALGAVPFPSAGIGAPHIRDRLYWVADALPAGRSERRPVAGNRPAAGGGGAERLADDDDDEGLEGRRQPGRERAAERPAGAGGVAGGVVDTPDSGRKPRERDAGVRSAHDGAETASEQQRSARSPNRDGPAGPVNGLWRAADWLLCRDGKWRPVEASPQPLADGAAESLGRVCDARVHQVAEEVNAFAMEVKIKPASALRALRAALGAQTRSKWEAGRLPGLHEAPFLLAFLRQLTTQGWAIEEDIPLSCSEDARRRVRVLRGDIATSGAPHQRGLDGQLTGERSDALHLLSSLLARHAQEAWGEAYDAYAEIGFPLGRNSRNRVMRLRGYGNAINAEAAQVWIESYLDAEADRRGLRLTESSVPTNDDWRTGVFA